MRRIIHAELERMMARKSTRVIFLINFLFPIIEYILAQKRWNFNFDNINGVKIILNNLNYPSLQMIDYHCFMIIVLLPLLFTEVLSLDIDGGAYRMIITKPYKKWKLAVSKWAAASIAYGLLLFTVYIVKTVIGLLFMPKAAFTVYFHMQNSFSLTQSILYNFRYYFVLFSSYITILGVCSVVANFIKKPIFTFIGTEGIIFASIYICKLSEDMIFNMSSNAYLILSGEFDVKKIIIMLIFDLVTFLAALFLWNRSIGERV